MKKLKRVLAVVTTLSMLVAVCLPVGAAAATYKYSAEASILNQMGLYAGISTESFVPDLGSTVTKEQGVTLLLRALGYKDYALGLKEEQIVNMLKVFSDAGKVSDWARPYMAAGISLGLVNGNVDFTLGPKDLMDSKMFAKLILADTDYTVDPAAYQSGPYILRENGALTYEEAAYFMTKSPLIRDDMVGMMFLSLKMKYRGTTTTLISKLVSQGLVSEALAISSGVYTKDLIDLATAKVVEYENAPFSTTADQTAALAVKAAAEALIAKFANLPTASTPTIIAIKAALVARIAARDAKVIPATFDILVTNRDYVLVNFTKAIDPATVENYLTLKINAGAPVSFKGFTLLNSNKTVKLMYPATQLNGTVITVASLEGLKTFDTAAIVPASKTANVSDTVAPVIGDTVAFGTDKKVMTLTVSEPLGKLPADPSIFTLLDGTGGMPVVKLDGAFVWAKVSQNAAAGKLTLTLMSDVSNASHTLLIQQYSDTAGNVGADKTITFNPNFDVTKPALSSAAFVNTMRVDFTFSENIAVAPKEAFTVGGIAAQSTVIKGAVVQVVLASELDASSVFGVTAALSGGLVADAMGNTADASSTLKVSATSTDTTAPALTYTFNQSGMVMTITANEAVLFKSGTVITVKNGSKTVYSSTLAKDTYLETGSGLAIDLFGTLNGTEAASYTIELSQAPTDLSLAKNAGAPLSAGFATLDTGRPAIAGAVANTTATGATTKLIVTFSEAVKNVKIENMVYTNDNDGLKTHFLGEDAVKGLYTMSWLDDKTLMVTGLFASVPSSIAMFNVYDMAGNLLTGNGSSLDAVYAFDDVLGKADFSDNALQVTTKQFKVSAADAGAKLAGFTAAQIENMSALGLISFAYEVEPGTLAQIPGITIVNVTVSDAVITIDTNNAVTGTDGLYSGNNAYIVIKDNLVKDSFGDYFPGESLLITLPL